MLGAHILQLHTQEEALSFSSYNPNSSFFSPLPQALIPLSHLPRSFWQGCRKNEVAKATALSQTISLWHAHFLTETKMGNIVTLNVNAGLKDIVLIHDNHLFTTATNHSFYFFCHFNFFISKCRLLSLHIADLMQTLSVNIMSSLTQNNPYLNHYWQVRTGQRGGVQTPCCSLSLSESLFLPCFLTHSLSAAFSLLYVSSLTLSQTALTHEIFVPLLSAAFHFQ